MLQLKNLPKLGLALSVPIIFAESKDQSKQDAKKTLRMIKPSKLPLYEEPQEFFDYEYHGKEKTNLEGGVSMVRKEFDSAYELTADTRESIRNICETGKAHTLASIDYVLDEENVAAKVAVISVGGLLGLLIGGRKKGFLKKIFYGSVAATGTAAFVYPQETSKLYQHVYDNAGDYSTVAYNFITGVKPQTDAAKSPPSSDPPKKIPPPAAAAPTSSSEKTSLSSEDAKKILTTSKDIVVKVDAEEDTSSKPATVVEGDMGQSNPEDRDLYTTRG